MSIANNQDILDLFGIKDKNVTKFSLVIDSLQPPKIVIEKYMEPFMPKIDWLLFINSGISHRAVMRKIKSHKTVKYNLFEKSSYQIIKEFD